MQYSQNKNNDLMQSRTSLTKFAWLSIGAAIATFTLKTGAYFLTGSVGLLPDAIESLVNLAGAIMALIMLTIAARPADEEHVYGHSKAEFFASVTEGILILGAAISIIITAIQRLIHPHPLEQIGIGLAVSRAPSPPPRVVPVPHRECRDVCRDEAVYIAFAAATRRHGPAVHLVEIRVDGRHWKVDLCGPAGRGYEVQIRVKVDRRSGEVLSYKSKTRHIHKHGRGHDDDRDRDDT